MPDGIPLDDGPDRIRTCVGLRRRFYRPPPLATRTQTHIIHRKSWRQDLNPRPAVYKTAALPLSYTSKTPCLTGNNIIRMPRGKPHRLKIGWIVRKMTFCPPPEPPTISLTQRPNTVVFRTSSQVLLYFHCIFHCIFEGTIYPSK